MSINQKQPKVGMRNHVTHNVAQTPMFANFGLFFVSQSTSSCQRSANVAAAVDRLVHGNVIPMGIP